MPNRDYIFFELTQALCSTCLSKVEAKVIFQQDDVYLLKRCPTHGREKVLICTDIAYYKLQRELLKPGQIPAHFNTAIDRGCPFDCGICPDHEQHGCVSIIEVTDHCNLECPVCYAGSSPHRKPHRSLSEIDGMLAAVLRNEVEPDVVQISGGEPTMHPEILTILDRCRDAPIKHLMLNTNGVRIANDPAFAEALVKYAPGFEVYLQFDSLREEPYRTLRGEELLQTKLRAVKALNVLGLSATLVMTVMRGVNDGDIGEVLRFARAQPAVRGVTLQPVQAAGRGPEPTSDAPLRMTVTEVRDALVAQDDLFIADDVLPVPCHPDCIAMAYALKTEGGAIPMTRHVDREWLRAGPNTITYERTEGFRDAVRDAAVQALSTGHSPESAADAFQQLLCCLPNASDIAPDAAQLGYESVFRVVIMRFMDAQDMDIRSVKQSCVHIVHPDGRLIPFDTYNLFYRPGIAPHPSLPRRDEGLVRLGTRARA